MGIVRNGFIRVNGDRADVGCRGDSLRKIRGFLTASPLKVGSTMGMSCKRLGEKGVPLTVFHGTADKCVPFRCGEQVAGWHAEGVRVSGGSSRLSNLYPLEGDTHGCITATQQLRDTVAQHLRV